MGSRRNQSLESEHGGSTVRKPHQPSIFLVAPAGYGQEKCSCPVCFAQPDGWDKNGVPRYKGGVITILVHRPSGGAHEAVSACRCEAGKQYSERSNGAEMAHFDGLPPNVEFVTAPTPILWVKGKSKGKPPAEIPIPNEDEYTGAHAAQMKRFMAGAITQEQWLANCKALDERYLPPAITGPTIGVLLDPNSEGLRGLYFASFHEQVDWSGRMDKSPVQRVDWHERAETRGED